DIAVIVDFAVESNDVATIGRMHRLRPAWAEIDDGEPALAQRHAAFGLDPHGARVRPAMPHGLDHGFADRAQRVSRCRRAPIDYAGNAAHRSSSATRSGNFTFYIFRFSAQTFVGCLVEDRCLALQTYGTRPIVLDHTPRHLA